MPHNMMVFIDSIDYLFQGIDRPTDQQTDRPTDLDLFQGSAAVLRTSIYIFPKQCLHLGVLTLPQ